MGMNENIKTAYNYFRAKGLSAAQSAGIVGNLQQESGVNPESQQKGGPGRGIAQWSQGGRWQPNLMTGDVDKDLNAQLDFLWKELNTTPAYGLSDLKAQTTATGASYTFAKKFERPAVIDQNRIKNSQTIYDALGDSPIATLPQTGGGNQTPSNPDGFTATPTSAISDVLGGSLLDQFKQYWIRAALILGGFIIIIVALHGLTSNAATPMGAGFDGGKNAGQNAQRGVKFIASTAGGDPVKPAPKSTGSKNETQAAAKAKKDAQP